MQEGEWRTRRQGKRALRCARTAAKAAGDGRHGGLRLPVHPARQRWSVRRRQVSWLTGQHHRPCLPGPFRSSGPPRKGWTGQRLTADSCGGQPPTCPRTDGPARAHGVPFSPARAGPATGGTCPPRQPAARGDQGVFRLAVHLKLHGLFVPQSRFTPAHVPLSGICSSLPSQAVSTRSVPPPP